MSERQESPLQRTIAEQIVVYLREGCVLTTADVSEISLRHGFTKRIPYPAYFGHLTEGSRWIDRVRRFLIADLEVIDEKVTAIRTRIIRSAELPLEETEFECVVAEIHNRRKAAALKGYKNYQ